jgi:hypothetical protein
MNRAFDGVRIQKMVVVAALLVLCSSGAAMAQDYPKAEAFLGYSYVRYNLGGDTGGVVHINFNGGVGAVSFNVKKSLGIVAEFSGYRFSKASQGSSSFSAKSSVVSYLFGPRISLRRERITPFAQVLFGGAHHGTITSTDPGICAPAASCTIFGSENSFAMTLGGGIDIKAGKHFSVRLGQIDYLLTRFTDASSAGTRANQNNFRYSAGIVIH